MNQIGDYVIAKKDISDVKEQSVGIVKNISGKEITVFFIGSKETVKTDNDHIVFLDVTKTGKPYPKKICNICYILKDNSEFEINQTDAKGRKTTRPSCRKCRILIDGKRPIQEGIQSPPKDLFTCPICEKTSIVGITAYLVKDHDHTTGKAREWICDSCNTGLGRFRDNIILLQKAIDYLKKYS